MAGYGSVSRLVLVNAVRGNQNGGHQTQGAERGRQHVGHNVAVVVLARPDEAALGADNSCDNIVDEGVEVLNASLCELLLVLVLVDLGEDVLETVVVSLGDGILSREPQALLCAESVVEARSCEAGDRLVEVVNTLYNAVAVLEIVNERAGLPAVLVGDYQLSLAALRYLHLGVLVDVAVCVTRNGDGLSPGRNIRNDSLYKNGLSEYGAVQDSADSAVRGLPHLLEVVLGHALCVRCDGSALYRYAVLLGCVRGVYSYLVVGLVSVNKAQVVVIGLEVNIRSDQDILDHLPYDTGHLVAVHLYQRSGHLNLISHCKFPFTGASRRSS